MTEKVAEILDKIQQIEYILDEIKNNLAVGSFKSPQVPAPLPSIPAPTQAPESLKEEAVKALGSDASLLTISDDGLAIIPNNFLADRWGNINMILIALDYQWNSAGKDSSWRYNPPATLGEGDYPDIANVSWLTKINDESTAARDTDPTAWAFVYKYDVAAKKATDEMRPEMAELVSTLNKLEGRPLLYKGFKFSLSRDGGTVFRNLA